MHPFAPAMHPDAPTCTMLHRPLVQNEKIRIYYKDNRGCDKIDT
jgi:hypothetical protein